MKARNFFVGAVLTGAVLYCATAFTEFPVLSEARDLWIETAMTTGDHQWLARIFPQSVIDKVMSRQIRQVDGIAGLGAAASDQQLNRSFFIVPKEWQDAIMEDVKRDAEAAREQDQKEKIYNYWWKSDPLKQKAAAQSGVDVTGRKVLVNDEEQGVMISLVRTRMFTGRVVQICDPSRVCIVSTDQKGAQGKLICDYLSDHNAILGINASGFKDPNGNGMGGQIIGMTRSSGQDWGDLMYSSTTIGFDSENRLLAGVINNWDAYNLRDAMQFGPVLIKDGNILTEGSAGWGLQPRTIVAQREDGAVLFLVVDGRKPGYSIGATMGDCAEILKEYGAFTAAACDGGSSSVLAYNGEIINKPSTPMATGRYLPNAFIVKKR